MKRYDLIERTRGMESWREMKEDAEGDYVLFSDFTAQRDEDEREHGEQVEKLTKEREYFKECYLSDDRENDELLSKAGIPAYDSHEEALTVATRIELLIAERDALARQVEVKNAVLKELAKCNCDVNYPEPTEHDDDCPYRIATGAITNTEYSASAITSAMKGKTHE